MTTVSDIMTRGVRSMTPSDTVVLAAQALDELIVGVIPVCDGDKLVGMVTDRDIVPRGVAQGRDNRSTRLLDVMSKGVRTVREPATPRCVSRPPTRWHPAGETAARGRSDAAPEAVADGSSGTAPSVPSNAGCARTAHSQASAEPAHRSIRPR